MRRIQHMAVGGVMLLCLMPGVLVPPSHVYVGAARRTALSSRVTPLRPVQADGDFVSLRRRDGSAATIRAVGARETLPQPSVRTATASRRLNPILVENSYPGTTAWRITRRSTSGHLIEGYAGLTSVDSGRQIDFYVNVAPVTPYKMDIFRMGFYAGLGARLMLDVPTRALPAREQPACPMTRATGLIACSWRRTYALVVPRRWTSGVYLALLTRTDGYQNYIEFVVRHDTSTAPYLFQSSVATTEAYNNWGGKSLYGATGRNTYVLRYRAHQVSFDRPYVIGRGAFEFLLWEYPMARWMERHGYDVTYATDVDTHESPAMLLRHHAFLSVGHDEYWSRAMRLHMEAALRAGVNLAFFGADDGAWQIRLSPSPLGRDRVITCYKSATLDPVRKTHPADVTTHFEDPPLNWPPNALIGEMEGGIDQANSPGEPFVVADDTNWVFNGVDVSNGTALPNMVGYEFDSVSNNGFTPRGLQILSRSPLIDTYGRHAVSNATVYTAPSGATVFAAGSIQWAGGLEDTGNGYGYVLDRRVQKITANVLARLGQRPHTYPMSGRPAPTTDLGANVIVNGSFDNSIAPWQVLGSSSALSAVTWTLDRRPTAVGRRAIRVDVTAGVPAHTLPLQLTQHIALTVAPYQHLTMGLWGRASSKRDVVASIQDSQGIVLAAPRLTLMRRWQHYEFDVQGAGFADELTVGIDIDPAQRGHVWLNGIELRVSE